MALQGLSFWSLTGSPKIWTSTVDLYAVELLRGEEEEDAALARRLMEAGAPATLEPLLPHQLIDSDPFSRDADPSRLRASCMCAADLRVY